MSRCPCTLGGNLHPARRLCNACLEVWAKQKLAGVRSPHYHGSWCKCKQLA